MKILTGKTGASHVTSQQFRQLVEGTVGQGSYILTSGENLEPELSSNNLLKIRSGMMSHHGNLSVVDIGTYDEVTIQNGTQGMKRIDLVVNRYTKNEETGLEDSEWVVIMGTPVAADPAAPAYTEGNLQEGDLVDDCPVYEVHLDGINVTKIVKLLTVAPNISDLEEEVTELNGKTTEKSYELADMNFKSFWSVTNFSCKKQGKKIFFSMSLSTNVQFDPNVMYELNDSPIPSEIIPQIQATLPSVGCGSNWENARSCIVNVRPDGYIEIISPVKQSFYKVNGFWAVG